MDNWQLYALLLIPVVLTVVHKYISMYGIQIAFRDFDPKYSYSTAVGLFNTAVNIIFLIVVNKIASKASDVQFV